MSIYTYSSINIQNRTLALCIMDLSDPTGKAAITSSWILCAFGRQFQEFRALSPWGQSWFSVKAPLRNGLYLWYFGGLLAIHFQGKVTIFCSFWHLQHIFALISFNLFSVINKTKFYFALINKRQLQVCVLRPLSIRYLNQHFSSTSAGIFKNKYQVYISRLRNTLCSLAT